MSPATTTPLADLLIRRIRETGPLSVAEYMSECLLHPRHGYYTTRTPFGAAGDFITAPEITQMFGELVGLALAQSWLDQGAPAAFVLAEAGPGRGTLMADILRATQRVPGFHDAMEICLIEASPALRAEQAKRVRHPRLSWRDTLDALPEAPLWLVANEFFDALPIRQFVRAGDGWHERVIGVRDGALSWGLTAPAPRPDLVDRLSDTRDGDLVEICPAAGAQAAAIGARIARHGGAALIFDYGDWRSLGDTFQALRAHAPADPLAEPGVADLTAHVDFEALARSAAPAAHTRLTPQGVFLERLGLGQRAQQLAQSLRGQALDQHFAAFRRLTDASEMGTVFKTLAFYPKGQTPPPGLDA